MLARHGRIRLGLTRLALAPVSRVRLALNHHSCSYSSPVWLITRDIQALTSSVWCNPKPLASLSRKANIDDKVSADQRGHGLGVSLSVYAISDLEQKIEAVRRLESDVLEGSQPADLGGAHEARLKKME